MERKRQTRFCSSSVQSDSAASTPPDAAVLIEEGRVFRWPQEVRRDRVERAEGRLLASLAEWVLNLARRKPLVLAIEDLHWVDPSSIELIGMLIELSVDVPLMIATARLEYSPPPEWRAADKWIVLERLSHSEIGELIAALLEANDLAEDVLDGVVGESVPTAFRCSPKNCCRLWLKARRSAGQRYSGNLAGFFDGASRPARSRPPGSAGCGRARPYIRLLAAQGGGVRFDHYVQSALDALIDAELIYMQGKPPKATYQFGHGFDPRCRL